MSEQPGFYPGPEEIEEQKKEGRPLYFQAQRKKRNDFSKD